MHLQSFKRLMSFRFIPSNGFKNVQNVIQIALKLLFFAKKSQKLPNGQTLYCNTLELRLVCSTRRLNETSFEQMHFEVWVSTPPSLQIPDSAPGRKYWIYFHENAKIIRSLILFL